MRDATDYYNLFPATLKNGNKQIIYLYNKRYDALEKGKYINVSTGCLITRNSPFYKSKDFYFYDDDEFPLCYKFSCRGLARLSVIRKILKFYADGLREYERTKDEEKMKELVDNEVEAAKRNYEHLIRSTAHGFYKEKDRNTGIAGSFAGTCGLHHGRKRQMG